jgi:hypothetical protein
VQHEAALGLHRAAEEHRLLGQFGAVQRSSTFSNRFFSLMSMGLLITRPSAPRSVCSHR